MNLYLCEHVNIENALFFLFILLILRGGSKNQVSKFTMFTARIFIGVQCSRLCSHNLHFL
jgi:hypothetical protein